MVVTNSMLLVIAPYEKSLAFDQAKRKRGDK
jgi:hypothetical protein